MAERKGKRIGFVDYDLNNYHADVYLALLRNDLKSRGYTVSACWGMKERECRAWAEKNSVPFIADADELDAAIDYYIILAPTNPETHLELCRRVFPFGKTTYVDKTFAPDLATAKKLFALAKKHRVAMQTTSVLRYTNVQGVVAAMGGQSAVRHMVAWGGGSNFAEYAIHPVELIVSCMGPGVTRLLRRGKGDCVQLIIDFTGGRTAVANVYVNANTPFAAAVTTAKETKLITVDGSAIFRDTAAAVLDLFDTGKPSIDPAESLAVQRIRDAAMLPRSLKGFVKV